MPEIGVFYKPLFPTSTSREERTGGKNLDGAPKKEYNRVMKIYQSVWELVGGTPLMQLNGLCKEYGVKAELLGKLECFNPAGSAKDRAAKQMLLWAEQSGELPRGGTVIEPTSGNTGIALAALSLARGYRVILVMPDTMSAERVALLRAYGATVELTPGRLGMQGAVDRAEELRRATPGAWIAGQFSNPQNPMAHYLTTGPELWRDTEGTLDAFVSAFGTGGTISGTGKYLKEQNPALYVAGVEPASSPLVTAGRAGAHRIQGIGANFIPENFKREYVDEVLTCSDERAYELTKALVKTEGLLCGISSGAALAGALELASRPAFWGKRIAVLLPDSGERYLSTGVFA